ncbi:MAG TPA: Tc toxin subunit A, partial [Nitrososphaeraceae archaeon]|nr:Tc toxin subunit A [Nitrososphaeraceae archaeon]
MSIFSPAAYFVDLMHFIDEHISKPVFLSSSPPHPDHPLYLKNRRRDLWNLKISCENTHTLIPYLTIVNEVLQSYLENATPTLGEDIFKTLSENSQNTNISFSLPYNLPFEEIQTYIQHFGISIFDIYKILRRSEDTIWRSKLGLSKEEFEVISVPPPNITDIRFRYGNPSSLPELAVQDFLKSSGLIRQQLDELLQIKFNDDLANISIERKQTDPDELMIFEEILKNLNNNRLDFIHRFIRLLRRTKWSIPEQDMVLNALKNALKINTSIDSMTVNYVAKLIDIKEKLNIGIEELCCMIDSLPVSLSYPNSPPKENEKKLFERVFDIKGLFEDPDTHTMKTSFEFRLSFNTNNATDHDVDPKMPLLLSGLGITQSELVLLFNVLKDEMEFTNGVCTLDLHKISKLYRYVLLAKALGLGSINDLVKAISVCFNVPPHTQPTVVIESIDHIFQLIDFKNWLELAPFNINELSFVSRENESSFIQFRTTRKTVDSMIEEVNNLFKDVQNSEETPEIKEAKKEALKSSISKLFNISSDQLKKLFKWLEADADEVIKNALEKDADDQKKDMLVSLMREIERVMLLFSNLKFTEKTVTTITEKMASLVILDNRKKLDLANLQSLTTYHKILDSMIKDDRKEDSDSKIGRLLEYDPNQTHHTFSSEAINFLSNIWDRNEELLKSISNLIL